MRTTLSALLVSTLLLSACGAVRDSRINPFNWFGGSRSEAAEGEAPAEVNPLIPRSSGVFARERARKAVYRGTPVETVTDLKIERVPGGAIIRATGVAAVQGVYDVQLTPVNDQEEPVDGVLAYRLDAVRASGVRTQGQPATREVIVARKVTDRQLRDVREIRVEGVQNAQVSRR